MTISQLNKFWALVTILLVAIIAIGGTVIGTRYSRSQPVEISIAPSQELQSKIYIGGAVNNPGLYPIKSEDNIGDIIQAAGGTAASADLRQLKLHIPEVGTEKQPQKVNLNQAEVWLLEALSGIGEVRAQSIIDYRRQNGPFDNINELIKVEGIGAATYEKIKHLITVTD